MVHLLNKATAVSCEHTADSTSSQVRGPAKEGKDNLQWGWQEGGGGGTVAGGGGS